MTEDIAAAERRIEQALREITPAAFGSRLKAIREKQGVSVRDLAERSRLSKTSIVNLEHGRSCRPVTIMKVCAALGLHVERFLDSEPSEATGKPAIHRRTDDRWFDLNGFASGPLGGFDRPMSNSELDQFHLSGIGAQMLMFKSRFPESNFWAGIIELTQPSEPRSHPGEEFIYVLRGHLDVDLGEERYRLEAGESMCFDPNTEHAYRPGSNSEKVSFFCFRMDVSGT